MDTITNAMRLVRETMAANSPVNDLQKAWLQPTGPATGLQVYDLEAPAKLLYPVLTPLRNKIPRVGGGRGTQANWRAITGVNTTNLSAGLGQGNRGAVISETTQDYYAAFRGIGLDNYVTFEADMSSEGFQDLKATAVQSLLRALMIQEEFLIIGGNGITGLGVTPNPVVTAYTSGGTILDSITVSVGVAALTPEGLGNVTVAGGVPGSPVGLLSRLNADGTTDTYGCGVAAPCATPGTVTTGVSAPTNECAVSAHVAPVVGAFGYVWFAGVSPNLYIVAVTTLNSVMITSLPTTGQLFSALSGDYSVNNLVFDGFAAIAAKPGSGAYWAAQPNGVDGTGTPLTADGSGGVVEIDAALQSFWDNRRLSPTEIWVSSQEQNYIRKKVLTAPSGSVPLSRFTLSQGDSGQIRGGTMVRGYLNPFGLGQAQEIPIRLHPNLPAGVMMFLTDQLPYALNDVQNVYQIKTRREYYQIEWPLRTRKYEYGVYADQVLQHYFPPSLGFLTNIGKG
jgi:hypothetical protein